MIQEKVTAYFQRFPELRVLFFFDESKEYEEEIKALELEDIHIAYWENTPFNLKATLTGELSSTKVFLYLPIKQPTTREDFQEFPLTGLLLANKELRLDDVGNFMEDYQLHRHQKSLVSKYIKELKYKGVQEVCKPILNASMLQEPVLHRALVSSFLNFKDIQPWSILVAKLLTLSNEEDGKKLDRVINKVNGIAIEDVVLQQIDFITDAKID